MNKAFIAIFMVVFLGFVGTVLVTLSANRVWVLSSNVVDYQTVNRLKYDALSCVSIARLKIGLGESVTQGVYQTLEGNCEIEEVNTASGRIVLRTSAEKEYIKVVFRSEIDIETAEILELGELSR